MKVFFILILLFSSSIPLFSQVKYEKEHRVSAEKVPEAATNALESRPFYSKVKWYREESLVATTYEAKVRFQGKKLSIEFDSIGQLEDVEIIIKWSAIEDIVRTKIDQELKGVFSKYRLVKIQRQWTGNTEILLKSLPDDPPPDKATKRYEIIVKGKSEIGWHWHEMTFSLTGELLSNKRIILRNTDNLEY
ncbi:MAG: hypothetical protein HRU41_08830 [Saprospiraceae bacterium]|nr:hypothetical protein [Saprospiraceae bacterium]